MPPELESSHPVGVIVLAGGRSHRFGGDKLTAELAGRPLLDHLLDGLDEDWLVVCVGPVRATHRAVIWTREAPPGGGPVAGIAAGLAVLPVEVDQVLVLAGDIPHGGAVARRLLADRDEDFGAAVEALAAVEDGSSDPSGGRPNPLAALYSRPALDAVMPTEPAGRAARSLLDQLSSRRVKVPEALLADVDTPTDLRSAETPIRHEPTPEG